MEQLILPPGEGLSVENPMGGLFTFKITSDESDGALTAIETFIVRPEGPPLHVHDQDEVIYTLEGSLRVKLGDTLREAPAGSFVFIPRGTAHTWQNVGAEPLRFFATIMPAAVGIRRVLQALCAAAGRAAQRRRRSHVSRPRRRHSRWSVRRSRSQIRYDAIDDRALTLMSLDELLDRYHPPSSQARPANTVRDSKPS